MIMPGLFTFLKSGWDNIISSPGILLPGIEQVSAIYWSSGEQQIKAGTRNKEGTLTDQHKELLSKPEGRLRIQKFRSVNRPFEWIRIGESPLLVSQNQEIDQDLFTEMQNTILVLRFRNESDSKYDILLIYLNKNLSQFGASLTDKVLSSDNKSIIGHILYNYFKGIHSINLRNHSILTSIQHSIRALAEENNRLKDEIRQVSLGHEEMIISLSQQFLKDLSERFDREYTLTIEASEKLKSYKGNVRHLPAILEQAVIFCENVLYFNYKGDIKLDASHISFDNFQIEEDDIPSLKRIDSRESKTIQLLDRLEKAALSLKSKDIPLTGSNIGRALAQPVTAPAITDALKKHRVSIINLLKKYPQKWEVIREEFRPVRNLFKQPGEERKEERA